MMNNLVRDAILRGSEEAGRLHKRFAMRSRIEEQGSQIDVFDTIVQLGLPLLFRPLDELVGAFIKDPPGVLVTTEHSLSTQRFIGAYELGHYALGHDFSLDDDSILRQIPGSDELEDKQRQEAEAFAAEFMLPQWLFDAHFERQGWTAKDMAHPVKAYQLSLRVGASYEATCQSLRRPGVEIIDQSALDSLLKVQPKEIKQTILGDYELPDWRQDVWLLTKKDEGVTIEGSHSDLFVLQLTEHSGAGYLWSFDELNEAGFAVVRNERKGSTGDAVGGHTTRSIMLHPKEAHEGRLALVERRPWIPDGDPLSKLCIQYDLDGAAVKGLSQMERRLLLEAA